jgi:hypothetical protein
VVLENNGEDQFDRSCEKLRNIRVEEDRNIPHKLNRRKPNWIGHIMLRNCLLKHINEGKIKRRVGVTGRRGRRGKQLFGDLKERVLGIQRR